jgi:hypothetical protein
MPIPKPTPDIVVPNGSNPGKTVGAEDDSVITGGSTWAPNKRAGKMWGRDPLLTELGLGKCRINGVARPTGEDCGGIR